jgi:hypothetical protein
LIPGGIKKFANNIDNQPFTKERLFGPFQKTVSLGMENLDLGILSLYYLLESGSRLEEPGVLYGINCQEQQTRELVDFIRRASQELERRGRADASVWNSSASGTYGQQPSRVRITGGLRIYIGQEELKVRPMAKSVLLLFLRHPEGIPLKRIADYREELAGFYRRVSRSQEPETIERSIDRILDLFSNDLNVSIARVNAAVEVLAEEPVLYRIHGAPGKAKTILLDRSLVVWE